MGGLNEKNLIWIDLEMTGLNPLRDRIIEIATVVTDSDLNVIAEGPVFAIHQPDAELEKMDEWNRTQHGKSGLTARVKASFIHEAMAETETLKFLQQHTVFRMSPMCGNTICQDRRFLSRWMPALENYFHYRNLDVSVLKELAARWASSFVPEFKKEPNHLALSDVYDSIAELKYYRERMLKRF